VTFPLTPRLVLLNPATWFVATAVLLLVAVCYQQLQINRLSRPTVVAASTLAAGNSRVQDSATKTVNSLDRHLPAIRQWFEGASVQERERWLAGLEKWRGSLAKE
jgi:hypothetical protein